MLVLAEIRRCQANSSVTRSRRTGEISCGGGGRYRRQRYRAMDVLSKDKCVRGLRVKINLRAGGQFWRPLGGRAGEIKDAEGDDPFAGLVKFAGR